MDRLCHTACRALRETPLNVKIPGQLYPCQNGDPHTVPLTCNLFDRARFVADRRKPFWQAKKLAARFGLLPIAHTGNRLNAPVRPALTGDGHSRRLENKSRAGLSAA